MSDMIERVAEALATKSRWNAMHEAGRNSWRTAARAAIEAMREPTPEMLVAGGDGWIDEGSIYRAMIDAALK